jgi:hypothetical protein
VQKPLRQLANGEIIVSSDMRHVLNPEGNNARGEDHQVQFAGA